MPWFSAERVSHPLTTVEQCYSMRAQLEGQDRVFWVYVGPYLAVTTLGRAMATLLGVEEGDDLEVRLVVRYIDSNGAACVERYEAVRVTVDMISDKVNPMYIALGSRYLVNDEHFYASVEHFNKTRYYVLLGKPLACVKLPSGHPGGAWKGTWK